MGKKSLIKKAIAITIISIFFTTSILPTISCTETEIIEKTSVKIQNSAEKLEDTAVKFYSLGINEQSTEEIQMSHEEVENLFSKISEYSTKSTIDFQSEKTQTILQEIFSLTKEKGLLLEDITANTLQNEYNPLSKQHKTKTKSILPLQNRASAFFCNFATTGTGSQFPVITFPRLIPIIQLPIPRAFLRWTATEGITSCGGLVNGQGYIAYGQQKGIALGFWGIGFSVFLPPIMQYGFIGYALFASTEAEEIELWPLNNPPEFSPINPYDDEINVPLSIDEIQFEIYDFDDDLMSYTVTTTPDIGSGSGTLKSDGTYSIPINGLEDLTQYTWHVEVSDGEDTTVDDYSFTTEAVAPIISNPSPQDSERYVPLSFSQLSFHLKDFQGDLMDYSVETVPHIGSGSGTDVTEGTYSIPINNLDYSVEYTWYVNATDGDHDTSKIFRFQTEHEMIFDPFAKGWQYSKEITIDNTRVIGDCTNFPVLISTTDVDLRDKAQDNGDDILFMDDNGVATRLYHEIEYYDGTNGELVVWVNISNLYSYQDTNLYMYYGNNECSNQQCPELIWNTDYQTVLHMNNHPDNSHIIDSTIYNNDGTKKGDNEPIETTGKIGKAQSFDGLNDYIDTKDFDINDDFTISLWINPCATTFNQNFIGKNTFEKSNIILFGYYDDEVTNGYATYVRTNSHREGSMTTDWQYLVFVGQKTSSSVTSAIVYKNGELLWQLDLDAIVANENGLPWTIGQDWDPSGRTDFFNGIIDEIRISNYIKNPEWIATEFNNQNDPSSFYNVGTEIPAP